jgi:hypothetical protein
MSLDVFPPAIPVLPNDKLPFEARAILPPPMWKVFDGFGVVQPDYSVRVSQPGVSVSVNAEGAFRLAGGVGSIEWTIVASCLPVSDGKLIFLIFLDRPGGTDWQYQVAIEVGRVKVFDEVSTMLADIPLPISVGMRFKVEIASGFRLFVNDVLQHSRTSLGAAVAYPAIYRGNVIGTPPFMASPPEAVPAPVLKGDWRLATVDQFALPIVDFSVEHGSLGAGASELQKIYSGGSVPGIYKLSASIKPGNDIWVEDAFPAGASTFTFGGDVINFVGASPTPNTGALCHKSANVAGHHYHGFQNATATLQINKDDVLYCWVFPDTVNPPTAVMLDWRATDASGFEHRAYWGASTIPSGIEGTNSKRFMGALPPLGQWTRLEVPASLLGLEGLVLNGAAYELSTGVCSFDQQGKYPSKLQRAESLITIPPLGILGDTTRTVQPGQKLRPQTNYDNAQTSLVSLSLFSGLGSISQGEYTARLSPGTDVVRATATVGNQVADIKFVIPPVITPPFFYAAPLETIQWLTNINLPTWSSIPPGINSLTGLWTAPSIVGQTVKITATDFGSNTVTRDVLILDKFPFSDFSLPVSWDRNLSALVSMSEDRTSRITREKAPAYDTYPVKLTSRTLADSNAVDAFFDAKGYGKPFILEDKVRGIRKVGWFDSVIRHEARDECDIDLSFQFLEARI